MEGGVPGRVGSDGGWGPRYEPPAPDGLLIRTPLICSHSSESSTVLWTLATDD